MTRSTYYFLLPICTPVRTAIAEMAPGQAVGRAVCAKRAWIVLSTSSHPIPLPHPLH